MAKPKVPTDPAMTQEVRSFLEDLQAQVDRLPSTPLVATDLITDYISGTIKSPAAQDYRLIEYVPFVATVTKFTAKTSSGTVTATLKINSTAITTGAINVTSTQGSVTPTALNVTAQGDVLVMTLSAISSPVDLSFTIAYTRPLS